MNTYAIPGNVINRKPENGGNGLGADDRVTMYTLTKTDIHAVSYIGGIDYENNAHAMDEPTGPLMKGSPSGGGRPLPAIATSMSVRRLTPTECERLQGFPDGYTDIMPNGKPTPDGPRYKALGNSMATNCMEWIGIRIQMVEEIK